MNNNVLITTNSYGSYHFTLDAFKDKEKTRAAWEAIVAEHKERADKNKIAEDKRTVAKREFREWFQNNHINISPRKIKSIHADIDDSIRTYYSTTPGLWAWCFDGKVLHKIDPGNGYGLNFDRAFDAVQAWLDWRDRQNSEAAKQIKAAVEYCMANNLDWTIDNVVQVATNHKVDKMTQEAIDERRMFEIDQCDGCDTWYAGERRCSCGNRRISLNYEGTFPDVYIYPEAY